MDKNKISTENDTNTTAKKKILAKKLPRNFKKSYTKVKLTKKLLAKIYIPTDYEFVENQFIEDSAYSEKLVKKAAELTAKGKKAVKKPIRLHIPHTIEYDKKDFNRLKSIAHQIKKQKGRIRLIPLIACASFIVGLVLFVLLAKNPLAKNLFITSLQSLAGAKVDISSVAVSLLNSHIRVNELAVANKNNPMTNVFEAKKIEVDFNFLQLLKGRFVAENIEVSGMDFGTERRTSGELPLIVKNEPQKKESEFTQKLSEKQSDVLAYTTSTITDIFDRFNPQTILNTTLEKLQVPQIAKIAQIDIERIISVWEDRPKEIETVINAFAKNTQSVFEYDYEAIDSIGDLQDAISNIEGAIQDGVTLSATIEDTINDLQSDSKTVQSLVESTSDAIQNDANFVTSEINKISSFTIDDGVSYLSDSLQTVVFDVLDTYYPYVEETLEVVTVLKPKDSKIEADPTIKRKKARMAGRTINYTQDIYPSFLIERMFASGKGFEANIVDISNDPDKWGKPVTLTGFLEETAVGGENRLHEGTIVVDARITKDLPLIFMQYKGDGYALSVGTDDSANIPGIPSFTSMSTIIGSLSIGQDGSFTVDANFDMSKVLLEVSPFEPAFAYQIYSSALNSIQNMSLGVQVDFSILEGIELDLKTNADTQFITALKRGMNTELNRIKEEIEVEIEKKLEQYIAPFNEELAQYRIIEKRINDANQRLSDLQDSLKQNEDKIQEKIKDTANDALQKTKDQAVDALEEKAKDALEGLFGR